MKTENNVHRRFYEKKNRSFLVLVVGVSSVRKGRMITGISENDLLQWICRCVLKNWVSLQYKKVGPHHGKCVRF